jgi:protein-L-isoaspartate(D-aspartate) O-methyltransferase
MTTTTTHASVDIARLRQAMVASQLRPNAVDDQRVVTAMATIPREAYLPSTAASLAYRDTAIPLGRARYQNSPLATARLVNAVEIVPADRVLLIGATGGYTAALLVELGAVVTAVESDTELVAVARTALGDTATVVEAPLTEGHAPDAPYDVLFVDGAVEELPDALLAQLRDGARIATGLVQNGVTRLAVGARTAGGHAVQPFLDAECVILPGFTKPAAFRF